MELLENKQTGNVLKYEYIQCHGLYNVTIHTKKDKNKPIGRCTVIQPIDMSSPVILDFVIYSQEHRRKKYGTELMEFVKHMFESGIKSSFYSKKGKEFAQKTGWKEVKKGGMTMFLFYNKEIENGNSELSTTGGDDETKTTVESDNQEKKEEEEEKKEEM